MALPTSMPAGHIPTGTEMQAILDEIRNLRIYVKKTADEAVNNSAVLQNDNQLFSAVEANSTYWVMCNFSYSSLTGADIKFGWSAPAGSSMLWTSHGLDPAGSYYGDVKLQSLNLLDVADCAGGGAVPCAFRGGGTLTTSSTAGTLQLRWAQLTATVGDSWVYANSDLLLMKVA